MIYNFYVIAVLIICDKIVHSIGLSLILASVVAG